MNAPLASGLLAPAPSVEFTLDGRTVTARAGETIWSVARREGHEIPHLCHTDGLTPVGNCRACMSPERSSVRSATGSPLTLAATVRSPTSEWIA